METALLTDSLPADVAGWWVSEKYDGVRAIWTGTKLLSRHGKDLKAPAAFTRHFPNRRLDGELWMGNGTFDQLVSTIQKAGSDWNGVRFMVFDLAETGTVEERIKETHRICDCKWPVVVVNHRQLTSHDDLTEMERQIVTRGGEGCVIRRPGSPYRPGRMGDVIKVKRLVADLDRWQG
jgi:DNA ligase-1